MYYYGLIVSPSILCFWYISLGNCLAIDFCPHTSLVSDIFMLRPLSGMKNWQFTMNVGILHFAKSLLRKKIMKQVEGSKFHYRKQNQ